MVVGVISSIISRITSQSNITYLLISFQVATNSMEKTPPLFAPVRFLRVRLTSQKGTALEKTVL